MQTLETLDTNVALQFVPKTVGVHLGRFAPYHKGHQMVTDILLSKHGAENSLILIGSSNTFNARTPFTFEQRKALIQKLYPGVKILPLPDINPKLLVHSESTIPVWLEQIKAIEAEMGVRFKFYGGCPQDLRFFTEDFETEVAIDRETEGEGVSASYIRELLWKEDYEALEEFMDQRIVSDAIRYFNQNLTKILNQN